MPTAGEESRKSAEEFGKKMEQGFKKIGEAFGALTRKRRSSDGEGETITVDADVKVTKK